MIYKFLLFCMCWMLTSVCYAGARLEALYPYSLEQQNIHKVEGSSTMPLYVRLTSYDIPHMQQTVVKVTLPTGFKALPSKIWRVEGKKEQQATAKWNLPENYGESFDLLYVQPESGVAAGEYKILVEASSDNWQLKKK